MREWRRDADELCIRRFRDGIRTQESEYLGTLEVWNCTFAKMREVGVDHQGGDLVLKNSIITAHERGEIGLAATGTGLATHSHNLLFGFAEPFQGLDRHAGERIANPRFVSLEEGDYRLRNGSPGINAGTDASGLVGTDIAGNPRPSHGAWKLGAHEYLQQGGSFRVLKWQERR